MRKIKGEDQTKNGDLLLVLQEGTKDTTPLVDAVSKSFKDAASVKVLGSTKKLAVLDQDELVNKEDILDPLNTMHGAQLATSAVESLFNVPKSQQTAVLTLPIAIAEKTLAYGRLRVGYTNCRVRLWEKREKCFRCLTEGHVAVDCGGLDRSCLCRKCGNDDHKAVACNTSKEEREEFRNGSRYKTKLMREEMGQIYQTESTTRRVSVMMKVAINKYL